MAVSKIAVMALVGILAVPILLGYALNLSEITETDYITNSDSVNVTPLLQNGIGYTYAHGDPYILNTNFHYRATSDDGRFLPNYSMTSSSTSMPGEIYKRTVQSTTYSLTMSSFNLYSAQFTYDWTGGNYVGANITYGSNQQLNVAYLKAVYYDFPTSTFYYTTYSGQTYGIIVNHVNNATAIAYYTVGTPTMEITEVYNMPGVTTTSIDLSAGYYFDRGTMLGPSGWSIDLPNYTRSFTMTIDLNSITDANYYVMISTIADSIRLVKTTTGSDITWKVTNGTGTSDIIDNIYYDPTRSDNTYQLTMAFDYTGATKTYPSTQYEYKSNIKLSYIGSWPQIFGIANSYNDYEHENVYWTGNQNLYVDYVTIGSTYLNVLDVTKTPKIRMDDAYFRAFEYPIIESKVYDPSQFKDNPSTTIKDITLYGKSISFGGNTYIVDKTGNITMGLHKVPVNNLVLKSVPVAVGYENRIGDTVVSVTADPSTITFDGKWSASIETTSQTATTYTKTEWIPGEFAWDGMDTNFLIVGLITCLGVFVALGIYVRKSGKGMIPLLIVCGCCAGLFFCMI